MAKMSKQIKSKKRVKEFAEVYTADREVKAMCDLIPKDIWENIESTFLEPACGNGNFIVEILERKYARCEGEKDGLKALLSVFGIDIQQDNVSECRSRLLAQFLERFPNASHVTILLASGILINNIVCGDFLNPNDKLKAMGCIPDEDYIKTLQRIKEKGNSN